MALNNEIDAALVAIDSVLCSSGETPEVVVVSDRSRPGVYEQLCALQEQNKFIRVFRSTGHGLTDALELGCIKAQGKYIARQDVGGRSDPRRLPLQAQILDENPEAAFAGCWTQFADPEFEPLFVRKGSSTPAGYRACIGVAGSAFGPTSHGSIMFRADAYRKAGGYRSAFLHAQDWDLWTRLGLVGTYVEVNECLYTHRIFPGGTSMRNRDLQNQFASAALDAARQRIAGEPDHEWVEQAQKLRTQALARQSDVAESGDTTAGLYFLGACLAQSNGRKARQYFSQILKRNPFNVRVMLRYLTTWWPAT